MHFSRSVCIFRSNIWGLATGYVLCSNTVTETTDLLLNRDVDGGSSRNTKHMASKCANMHVISAQFLFSISEQRTKNQGGTLV